MDTREAADLVIACLGAVLETHAIESTAPLDADTHLMGEQSLLDSVALVDLLLSVEDRLAGAIGASVTLASEHALSRSKSPFRTVRTLAEYIEEVSAATQ